AILVLPMELAKRGDAGIPHRACWKTLRVGAPRVQASITLVHSAPTPSCGCSKKAVVWCDSADARRRRSVPVRMDFLHGLELLRRGPALVFRFPGLVGHAVDGLPALVLAQGDALGVGGVLEPVGQAVAAEAGQIHQVDILDV